MSRIPAVADDARAISTMVIMPDGGSLLSPVLTALLLVSLSLGALPGAVAADGDPGSPPACCARVDASDDPLESGSDTDAAGGSSLYPGICSGTALPAIVTDSSSKGADPHPGPPDDWLAGCAHAPDPFPPKSLYTTYDYMGFIPHPTDPSLLFASGHPAGGGNLGFIVSNDGGKLEVDSGELMAQRGGFQL